MEPIDVETALAAWEAVEQQARSAERQFIALPAGAITRTSARIRLSLLQVEADRLLEVVLERLRANGPVGQFG